MAKTSKFDAADYLKTPEQIAAYLTEALETGDTAFVCTALDAIARAKGMSDVARATGLGRESLYKSVSGNTSPAFDTIARSSMPSTSSWLPSRSRRERTWLEAAGGIAATLRANVIAGREVHCHRNPSATSEWRITLR